VRESTTIGEGGHAETFIVDARGNAPFFAVDEEGPVKVVDKTCGRRDHLELAGLVDDRAVGAWGSFRVDSVESGAVLRLVEDGAFVVEEGVGVQILDGRDEAVVDVAEEEEHSEDEGA
jgi:hypothetical protein